MKRLLISKKLLEYKYIKEQKSIRTIAKEIGAGKSTILSRLHQYNIPVRKNTELRKGMKFNQEWKDKISKNHADVSGYKNPMFGIRRCGPNAPGWQGGKTKLIQGIRSLQQAIEWRDRIYKRDHYQCQDCNDKTGRNLNADHIIPLSYLIKKHKVLTTQQAIQTPELWDIDNGRTLCRKCHRKTSTWGAKAKYYKE